MKQSITGVFVIFCSIALTHASIYNGCGETKTCFGFPKHCLDSQSCTAITTVIVENNRYFFEVMSKGSHHPAYVATALSLDTRMEDDSAMECVPENGQVNIYTSWTGRSPSRATRLPAADSTFIHLINSSFVNGNIYCKIERDAVSVVHGQTFDLVHGKYHLLLATGTTLRDNSVGSHNIGRAAASHPINLSQVTNLQGGGVLLLRLHGAFMVVAWMGTASIGIILARYFKKAWMDSQVCGSDQWFVWHRICMTTTWLLTIAAFVIIFVEVGGWASVKNPHAILGVITTAICFFQPIGAAFRPSPYAKMRPFFNWIHWLGGNLSHVFASEYFRV